MTRRVLTLLVVVGLLYGLLSLWPRVMAMRLPGNDQGYAPVQPIAYSHRVHAGELEIPCLYCHFGAEKSRHADIPPATVCMNCHQRVTARWVDVKEEEKRAAAEKREPRPITSAELQKLYDALAVAPDATGRLVPDPTRSPRPIAWVQVHSLPAFVAFDHRRHVAAGVTCQTCHGPVETMERMRQHSDLSMGWCVNCHREVNRTGVNGQPVHASTDCAGCHY